MFALFTTIKLFIFVGFLNQVYSICNDSNTTGLVKYNNINTVVKYNNINKLYNKIPVQKNKIKYELNFERDVLKKINYYKEGYCPDVLVFDKRENMSFRDEDYCIQEYMDKFIRKMNIEYVQFNIMRLIIREITYEKNLNNQLRKLSRRKKRKLRKQMRKNYNFFSNSKEVDSMRNICSIDYDTIDYKTIKYKYNRFLKKYNFESIDIESFKYILIVFMILMFISVSK